MYGLYFSIYGPKVSFAYVFRKVLYLIEMLLVCLWGCIECIICICFQRGLTNLIEMQPVCLWGCQQRMYHAITL